MLFRSCFLPVWMAEGIWKVLFSRMSEAIEVAGRHGFVQHEALANELAGRLALKAILTRYPDFRIRREGLVRHRAHGQVAGWSCVPAIRSMPL